MNSKSLKNILLIIISIGSIVFLVQLFIDIYKFLDYPFQNEYRQVAFMPLVNGIVPIPEWFSGSQSPNNLYVYGFFYPFLIKIFPITDKLLASKIVSVLSLLFSSTLLLTVYLKGLNDKKKENILILPVFIGFFLFSGYRAVLSSTPSALGQFLFLACIFLPFLTEKKIGLLLAAILGILAFYSKPYYALSLPFAAIGIFLFQSKKRALELFNIASPIFLISVFLIHFYWPGYFTRTFFTHLGYPIKGNWSHLWFQLEFIFEHDFVIIGAILIILITGLYLLKRGSFSFNFNKLKKPLILNDSQLEFTSLVIILLGSLLFLVSMGKHVGSSYGHYYYHLVYPFILVFIFRTFNRDLRLDYLLLGFFALQIVYSTSIYNSNSYLKTLKAENEKVDIFLSQFDNILNTANVAGILYNQNKMVYDNGNMEYFYDGRNHFFGDYKNYVSIHSDFQNDIKEKVNNSEFDLIMNNYNIGPYLLLGNSKNLNYQYIGSIKISNPKGELLERLFLKKELLGNVEFPDGLELIQEAKN